jgi:hypothetical protein
MPVVHYFPRIQIERGSVDSIQTRQTAQGTRPNTHLRSPPRTYGLRGLLGLQGQFRIHVGCGEGGKIAYPRPTVESEGLCV